MLLVSVNHSAKSSGPAAMPAGKVEGAGIGYSPTAACCAGEMVAEVNNSAAMQPKRVNDIQRFPFFKRI